MERPRGAQASGLSAHGAAGEHGPPPGPRSGTREGFGTPGPGVRPSPPPRAGTLFRFGPCAGRVPAAAFPPRPPCARSQGRRLPIAATPSLPGGGCLCLAWLARSPREEPLNFCRNASLSASVLLRVGRAGCSRAGAGKGGEPCAPPSAPGGRALGPQVHPARRGPSPGWVPV